MLQQFGPKSETYLTSGHAFQANGSNTSGETTIQYNMYGFMFSTHVPPKFDGTDYYSFVKASKYWYDTSTLQEKNKVTTLVNNFTGLATNWHEELNRNMPLLQSSGGLDYVSEFLKKKLIRPGYHAVLVNLEKFNRMKRKSGENSWTLWNQKYNRFHGEVSIILLCRNCPRTRG